MTAHGLSVPAAALLALSIAACQAAPSPSPTPLPATRQRPQLGPTSTASVTPPSTSPQTPTPTLLPLAPVGPDDWQRGPQDAAVTMLVYSDFDCAPCAELGVNLDRALARHADRARLIYRHYPLLGIHDMASLAGQAAEAAGEQGEFWPMHDILIRQHAEWSQLNAQEYSDWLLQVAGELGLDQAAFHQALEEERYAELMETSYRRGLASGLPGVPFLIINDRPFLLGNDEHNLEAAVRLALLQANQYPSYPGRQIEPNGTYVAHLEIDGGTISVRLLPESAPLAANSFVFLAKEGWYDGSPIYRVVPEVLVELGDPSGTGLGDAGYHYGLELDPSLSFEQTGMVAMINAGPDTNSSRFFINLAPLPDLDGTHTIFGRVLEGLDSLRGLPARDPLTDILDPALAVLERVRIERR